MTTTLGARRSALPPHLAGVVSRSDLALAGVSAERVAAQVAAARWQLFGTAVVLHNAALSRSERAEVARLSCGPRALLTAFTAAEHCGLRGWERDEVHVLAPRGTASPRVRGCRVRLHRVRDWSGVRAHGTARRHALPDALVVAASTFASARPGCGLLAAAVQQRLTTPALLADAVRRHVRLPHRRALRLAVEDIAGGSQALSEIDFAALCRRAGLPAPRRQSVRPEPGGKRRYLDAEWDLPDGRAVVVEVDGAVHLAARVWWDDQLRQNALVLSGAVVLRFPSVVVRTEPALVVGQLRRALPATVMVSPRDRPPGP